MKRVFTFCPVCGKKGGGHKLHPTRWDTGHGWQCRYCYVWSNNRPDEPDKETLKKLGRVT
jgi:hypothetical protein